MIEHSILPTGVSGLDTILGGGLSPKSLVLLVGAPGAGKTILASQLLVHATRTGSRGLIITNFSEGSVKLLAHLGTLTFFDPTLIQEIITLLPFTALIGENPEAIATAMVAAIRQLKVQWVLIDGLQGAASLLGPELAMRRFLGTLANLIAYLDVTCLVTLEGDARNPAMAAELTVADVVLGLQYSVEGWRHLRRIEVVKHRGQATLSGLHSYTITADGFTIFPRLEALPPPPPRPITSSRARFGLPELDGLVAGGLTQGTTTVLAGAPGTGKTNLALHWALADIRPEQPTIFVSFDESAARLSAKARDLGLDLDGALASGAVLLLTIPSFDITPDIVFARVFTMLSVPEQRVVFDDIGRLIYELGSRTREYLAALAMHFASWGVTSLYTLEMEPFAGFQIDMRYGPIQPIAENMLVLHHTLALGALHYALAVIKTRFSPYDPTVREIVLTAEGIRVLPPQETTPEVIEAIIARHV